MSTYDIESALRAKGGDVEEAFKLLSLYSHNEIVAKAGNETIDLTSPVEESLSATEEILSDQTPKQNDSSNDSESDDIEMRSPNLFQSTAPTPDLQDLSNKRTFEEDMQQQQPEPDFKRPRLPSKERGPKLPSEEGGSRSVRVKKEPISGDPTQILPKEATFRLLEARRRQESDQQKKGPRQQQSDQQQQRSRQQQSDQQENVQIFPFQQQESSSRSSSQGAPSPQQTSERSQMTAKYRIEKFLGKGAYGETFKVWNTATFQPFALKIFKEKEYTNLLAAFREYSVLLRAQSKTLLHEHVVEMKGYFQEGLKDNLANADEFGQKNDNPMILYNLIVGESLAKKIMPAFSSLSTRPANKNYLKTQLWLDMHWMAYQLFGGLTYLHAKGIMHRDIKSDNIMIETLPDGKQRVVIIDLGLSCVKITENDRFKTEDEIHCDLPQFAKNAGLYEFTSPDLAASYLNNIRIDEESVKQELTNEQRMQRLQKISRETLEANDVYAAALTLLSMVVEKPQHTLLPNLEAIKNQSKKKNQERKDFLRQQRKEIFREIADSNHRVSEAEDPNEGEEIKYYFFNRIFGPVNTLEDQVNILHTGLDQYHGGLARRSWSVALMSVYEVMNILAYYNRFDFTAIKSRNKIHEFWEREATAVERSFVYDLEGKKNE